VVVADASEAERRWLDALEEHCASKDPSKSRFARWCSKARAEWMARKGQVTSEERGG